MWIVQLIPEVPSRSKTRERPILFPYLVLLLAQLAVGAAAILARTGLRSGLSPVSLAAWRLTVASAILIVGMRFSRRWHRPDGPAAAIKRKDLTVLVVAGILLGLHFAMWFASLQTLSVARSTLLVATVPVWTGLAEKFVLGRTVPLRFWAGLALAGVGIVLLTAGGETALISRALPGTLPVEGDLLAIAGAVTIAAYLLIAQRVQPKLGSLRMVTWTYSLAALILWPAVLVLGNPSTALPLTSLAWISILGMALFPQLVGHTAMNWSLHHFSAGVVAAATLLEPVFAAALAWWIFSERVSWVQAIGGIVLLAGVGVAALRAQSIASEGTL